jgi:hypothetical protein
MSVRTLFWRTLLSAASALNATGLLPSSFLGNVRELAIYVVFSAGTTAGVVLVEGSHDENFSGTWATLATVTFSAANRCHHVALTGCHRAVRVRISTAIADGTVDAYVMAN